MSGDATCPTCGDETESRLAIIEPSELAEWDPDHILVGHGTSVHEGTQGALAAALGLD